MVFVEKKKQEKEVSSLYRHFNFSAFSYSLYIICIISLGLCEIVVSSLLLPPTLNQSGRNSSRLLIFSYAKKEMTLLTFALRKTSHTRTHAHTHTHKRKRSRRNSYNQSSFFHSRERAFCLGAFFFFFPFLRQACLKRPSSRATASTGRIARKKSKMSSQPISEEERQARLQRWINRLQSLPSIALPTDYPRPASSQIVQAVNSLHLSAKARTALVRLAIHHEIETDAVSFDDDDVDEKEQEKDGHQTSISDNAPPSPFHLLLAAFVTILHRYTGDTDIVVGSSSPLTGEPIILRIPIEPVDPFWQIVRRIQQVEREAANDAIAYDDIVDTLEQGKDANTATPSAPIFRVRFFDETGAGQRSFLQNTSLTTDLTVFVTRLGRNGDGTSDLSSSTSTLKAESIANSSTSSQAPSRGSVVPDLSLQVSYNALLFSNHRTKLLLAHMSHVITAASLNPSVLVGTVGLRTANEDGILPDPRKDLDFCGFRGSITSIFEKNAKQHPDRRCLIESLPPKDTTSIDLPPPASRVREITYAQLDEASNILAHHLLQAGVQREEVVTVYAYRGVDLVVAVIGTLKAGATFSVIDPAYPPSRQNIYLQVAKPRALVVLAKAGTLHPSVRKCIQEELEIRTEVPALELHNDGTLTGGNGEDGRDILSATQQKANQSTNMLLGPDSVATLSFTSGSTGIPKGVRGRHHSLTHFFPWMGERFELGSHSRFTMLSGIAHDPIQRDIFTPLFFGAELHIPTADDIGTPGRLAEWMAATKATVTHLTPAMGQLLSAQATAQIPALRNAFFVGDILTKRDCTRLQALAQNVRIINMYGTTETQRAVSYFEIPDIANKPTFLTTQKDVMPAGQGMIDVQLLVVNRNERTATCAVGEVGEIYVRSGGLAEGYLGPDEVTAEKFVSNFLAKDVKFDDTLSSKPEGQFWKGIRDRMYRTGDLGRYLPDGTVECTGRADDQVKIRGFRIELGEIDLHLSRHQHVRENVTLVRRDKDEEKVLVSYFVPGAGASSLQEASESEEESKAQSGTSITAKDLARGMRRYRELIKDIRDHLKKKLPAYSVPTLFVPLLKMPLNPNGKIDKPALPFPDTALANAAMSSSSANRANGKKNGSAVTKKDLTPTEERIADLFAELLPSCPRPVPTDESFFDLGGHSILATRLVFAMRKAFVVNVPLGVVFESPSVSALANQVDKLKSADLQIDSDANAVASTLNGNKSEEANSKGEGVSLNDEEYDKDVGVLTGALPDNFISAPPAKPRQQIVLLTGATGFLGIFVLRDLLVKRQDFVAKVIVHVRAKDKHSALARLRTIGEARQCWNEEWITSGKLDVVIGDLASDRLGMDRADWSTLAQEVDAVIHNGALVHWVYPYKSLRAPNVLSTLACIQFCASGKPKTLTFVSSTSALDSDHYVRLSDSIIQSTSANDSTPSSTDNSNVLAGVPETDDLLGSAHGLNVGYGQSKYVSERLIMVSAARGLRASIVRPGYVLGDSETSVTNTDDFIWRLVKSGTQLGLVPDIHNSVNMTPVDHVARITVLASLETAMTEKPTPGTSARVYHVTGHPTIRFNDVLSALQVYGWNVKTIEYVVWRTKLEEHVLGGSTGTQAEGEGEGESEEQNALFPLLHFVLDDLPTSTKSAELDDRHTQSLLRSFGEQDVIQGVNADVLARYLAWLVAVGYLKKPEKQIGQPIIGDAVNSEKVKALPIVNAAKHAAIGRGSAN